jgi:hypothetical protein
MLRLTLVLTVKSILPFSPMEGELMSDLTHMV